VVAYQMLTGRAPFAGTGPTLMRQVVEAPPPSLRAANPSVPPAAEAAVQRAMAKSPGARFATAREFVSALAGAGAAPSAAEGTTQTVPVPFPPALSPPAYPPANAPPGYRAQDGARAAPPPYGYPPPAYVPPTGPAAGGYAPPPSWTPPSGGGAPAAPPPRRRVSPWAIGVPILLAGLLVLAAGVAFFAYALSTRGGTARAEATATPLARGPVVQPTPAPPTAVPAATATAPARVPTATAVAATAAPPAAATQAPSTPTPPPPSPTPADPASDLVAVQIDVPASVAAGAAIPVMVIADNKRVNASQGGITVSAPESNATLAVVSTDAQDGGRVYQPGEQVSLLFPCCSKVTLKSPVAEAWNPRGWPVGVTHRLSLRITPAGNPGEVVVYVRVAFLAASGEQIYYPPSGSPQDQQGAPVLTRRVQVGR
jgi:serine/threonine-protein kinase